MTDADHTGRATAVRTTSRPLAGLTAAALAAGLAAGLVGAAPAAATTTDSTTTAQQPAVFVSEILANNSGADYLEYFEVTNTTDAAIDLAAEGISFAYTYTDGPIADGDNPLAIVEDDAVTEKNVVLAPGEAHVFWLSTNETSQATTVDEFKAATGAADTTRVSRVIGQGAFANAGDRGIRVDDPSGVLNWSYYPAGSMADDLGVDFRVPAETGAAAGVLGTQAPMTPGTVTEDALTPAEPEPEGPGDVSGLEPDPSVVAAPLQITELLPDSTNVDGADGYEFIEVYNASAEPVDFSDYALTYLYPADFETNNNEAAWPVTPSDVTIDAGDTMVVWVKNGKNDHLTDADFNAHFGAELTSGVDLVEVYQGGMANGSARGVALRTSTGHGVNRAYYNMTEADDTAADQGIRYTGSEDVALQNLLDARPASPGRVQTDQVPGGLMVPDEDTAAPAVTDNTVETIDPAEDFVVDLAITDDVQVKTVTLNLHNDVDTDPIRLNMLATGADRYTYAVASADLTGKGWYEYTVTVSDGTRQTTTEPRRTPVDGASTDPVRLNVEDGQFVGGTTTVSAAGEEYPSPIQLSIDGNDVATRASLESEPYFVFEVSQTDYYFRNGVRIGDDTLHIFLEGTYGDTETMAVPVGLEYIEQGQDLTVGVWAGTKAGPWIDEAENNDDFVISGMRLILPDGRTLRPAGYEDPREQIKMGDSTGKHDFYDSTFTLPDDAFAALAHDWDTTGYDDGAHQIAATDGSVPDGSVSAEAGVLVDNTAPAIEPSLADGETYQGEIVLDAEVTDAGSGVADTVLTLDGEVIEPGTTASSVELEAGEHTLSVTATDEIGNSAERTVTFTTPVEAPSSSELSPADGATVSGETELSATVTDPSRDALDVSFLRGHRFDLADGEVDATAGTTDSSDAVERSGEAVDAAALATEAGLAPVTTTDALPFYQFEVPVPADAGEGATARLNWAGEAEAGAELILYALSADGTGWTEVTRTIAEAGAGEAAAAVELSGSVDVAAHAADGTITALVQHTEGYAGADHTTRESAVEKNHPEDTDRSEYDFSIAWESDTQYYHQTPEYFEHQQAIHDYVLDQREEQNIQYLIHTGDIVNNWDQQYQWDAADPEYQRLDDAGMPYGVLAGNHDVGGILADYGAYSTYFGEDRYASNPWYGESHQDNRGHYDLITAGGIDFLMLYMGWDPQQEQIDWMNEVLAKYPERVAVINLHEFMLTTGGLGPIPQQILDEVVEPNPNVRVVTSGHYHDAFKREFEYDDDGDGVMDRTATAMLFDYQGLEEGGLGYLRMLQFDNSGEQMRVRTFSPSLHEYNSEDESLMGPAEDPYQYQDFTLGYAQLGIEVTEKSLVTTGFTAEILTGAELGAVSDVASGDTVSVTVDVDEQAGDAGTLGWYVRAADEHGGVDESAVREVVVTERPGDGDGRGGPPSERPGNGGDNGKGKGGNWSWLPWNR
ncbi:lamin tail domain-containing protein [Zhihengliuella salsuginis]|uniref:LTD domain-containing protein n=1 Tax=Zhihengliuella salsuginis TaxID=578222 RepID=A0ABQ3GLM7_9MICC|nr:lamin tail domain-containing protein [Zhihengliuella salsuginis]GHD13794.1 hypothetical protein GCM10008096_30370 [Zhihengliuella salsuginis]